MNNLCKLTGAGKTFDLDKSAIDFMTAMRMRKHMYDNILLYVTTKIEIEEYQTIAKMKLLK